MQEKSSPAKLKYPRNHCEGFRPQLGQGVTCASPAMVPRCDILAACQRTFEKENISKVAPHTHFGHVALPAVSILTLNTNLQRIFPVILAKLPIQAISMSPGRHQGGSG